MKSQNERNRERYDKVRNWIQRNFKRDLCESTIEGLGTYATTMLFQQYHPEHIVRKKDGTPDWDKERALVRYLWRQTFKQPTKIYIPTEGDRIRYDLWSLR